MSVLYPWMLLGLAALAVPVALHLIAKQRFPPQEFPSLRLLSAERRANVFAWRLVDRGQLLVRLAVLLLLVVAMARLFSSCSTAPAAPRNLVVVLDASASMNQAAASSDNGRTRTLFDLACRQASDLLAGLGAPSRALLLVAGDRLQVLGRFDADPQAALKGLDAVRVSDGGGVGLLHAVAEGCEMLRGRHEVRSQVVVFTDGRASALTTRNQRDLDRIAAARQELGARLDMVFVDLAPGNSSNVAVIAAGLKDATARVGEDVHVLARIVNSGDSAVDARLRLAVGGREEPVRTLSLPAGSDTEVDLTSPLNRSFAGFAEVRNLAEDSLAFDDRRLCPLMAADVCRILLVRGDDRPSVSALDTLGTQAAAHSPSEPAIDGAAILRYALNPGRELGSGRSTGIDVQMCGPDALPGQTLSKFDIVVLYDVSQVPEKALADLEAYVRQGRALMFMASGNCNAPRFNRTFATARAGGVALAPAALGNDRDRSPAVGLDPGGVAHPALALFRDRNKGDLGVLRFTKLRDLDPGAGGTVTLRASDGSPLAVESRIDEGRCLVLAFSVELDRGNVARTRAFPVMMWRWIDHLAGRLRLRPPDVIDAGRPAVLDAADPAFALASELELAPFHAATNKADTAVRRMPVSRDRTVLVDDSAGPIAAGGYLLHRAVTERGGAAGYARPVAVVPDARESLMEKSTQAGIGQVCPGARLIAGTLPGDFTPHGYELWRWVILFLGMAYMAEAVTGLVLTARRERREEGAS